MRRLGVIEYQGNGVVVRLGPPPPPVREPSEEENKPAVNPQVAKMRMLASSSSIKVY